jgi:hypothetical protein
MAMSVEDRLDRLESIQAICALKAQYCTYCDNNYDPEGISSQFTEDGVWNGEEFGSYKGKKEIADFFRRISASIAFAGHIVTNPNVTFVDRDNATATWRLFEPVAWAEKGKTDSRLILAGYVDKYVRENGVWKFREVNLHVNFFSKLEEGWAATAVR